MQNSVQLVWYLVLLVRNFPGVAKAGSILGHCSTHCGKIICITKTQIYKVMQTKICEKRFIIFLNIYVVLNTNSC